MIDSVLNHAAYGPADGCGTFVCLSSYLGEVLLLAVVEFFLLVYVVSRLLKSKPHPGPVSKVEIEENGGSITFNLEVYSDSKGEVECLCYLRLLFYIWRGYTQLDVDQLVLSFAFVLCLVQDDEVLNIPRIHSEL